VPSYRIYHVGNGGRLRLGDLFQAPHDEAAVASAEPLLIQGQEAELWQGGRIVGRFSAHGAFTPSRGG
jgi:hypothetical protein